MNELKKIYEKKNYFRQNNINVRKIFSVYLEILYYCNNQK